MPADADFDALCLSFHLTCEEFGQVHRVSLVDNGEEVPVTAASRWGARGWGCCAVFAALSAVPRVSLSPSSSTSRADFVRRAVRYLLVDSALAQMQALRSGFLSVVGNLTLEVRCIDAVVARFDAAHPRAPPHSCSRRASSSSRCAARPCSICTS